MDIADVRLAETIFAPHYAAPMPHRLKTATDLTRTKDGDTIEALGADAVFEVLEVSGDYAWGVARPSGLVGYVALSALAAD